MPILVKGSEMTEFHDLEQHLEDVRLMKTFDSCRKLVLAVIKLLDKSVNTEDLTTFDLFTDGDGKLTANGSWFFNDTVVVDKKATYKVLDRNTMNLDFKVFGLNKLSKRIIAWSQALTPNFEDEPFNSKFAVGIDFVIPASHDRVVIVLSNNYVIRTLELHDPLTATFKEILSKWDAISDFSNKRVLHTQLWESLDLHPINKKFYEGISERFINLRQHLVQNKILDERHASQFANRLIGRLVFCWFMRKKNYIDAQADYFNSIPYIDGTEYYREKLEALFFGILNKPISERVHPDTFTPYLNGGLFEEKTDDLVKNPLLSFPKNYFDDLYIFLNSYNFTTDESTSEFQQVAIDPEMLGRIFENLLAEIIEESGEQARKAKGAFYTPREIVDYMCRESLREYLLSVLPKDANVKQRLGQLIDGTDREFIDQDHNWRRDWKPYKEGIIEALDNLRILDPACGSGAYPMGMLQLLVKMYERLEPRFDHHKAKLQIMEKNIYGVDIEPMAVEISRLRAWLSLIVEIGVETKYVQPLPNLDFKFVSANSLIPLSEQRNLTIGEDPDLSQKLQDIREKYFATELLKKKEKLRAEYEKLISVEVGLFGESSRTTQLKTHRPFDAESVAIFFDPIHMFGIKNFDIVISNPPYVHSQDMVKGSQADTRKFISKTYKYAKGNWDLYIAFFERGLDLLGPNGVLTYITPDKWLSKPFGDALREGTIDQIHSILIAGRKVFTTATVDSIITLFNVIPSDEIEIYGYLKGSIHLKNSYLKSNLSKPYNLDFLFSDHLELLERLLEDSIPLASLAVCENSCGTNDAYLLKKLIFDAPNGFDPLLHMRLVNTGTLGKFHDRWGVDRITYLGEKYTFPVVNKDRFLETFPNSYSKKSIRKKLIVKGLNLLDASIDESGEVVPGIPTLIVSSEDIHNLYFALGLLNSRFAIFYIKERYPASSYNQGTTFTKDMLNKLPIPKSMSKIAQAQIGNKAMEIVREKERNISTDTTLLEDELNCLVYRLYQLSQDEVKLIVGN